MTQQLPRAVDCEVLEFPDVSYYAVSNAGRDEATIIGTYPAGFDEPEHVNHRCQESWVVLSGALEIHLDGTPVKVSAGQRIGPITPGTKHRVTNPGEGPAVAFVVASPGAVTLAWLREISVAMMAQRPFEELLMLCERYGVEVTQGR